MVSGEIRDRRIGPPLSVPVVRFENAKRDLLKRLELLQSRGYSQGKEAYAQIPQSNWSKPDTE